MDLFTIFSKWFWAMGIATTCANAIIYARRAQKEIRKNPELEEGYRTLIKGFLIWGNIPWIVMGIGCLVGGVPSLFHFFRPRDGNPFVLSFFASVFLIWVLGTHWLFFQGGAEKLAKHPGLITYHTFGKSGNITNPAVIKLFWLLCIAGGIVGAAIMFTVDIPIPAK